MNDGYWILDTSTQVEQVRQIMARGGIYDTQLNYKCYTYTLHAIV